MSNLLRANFARLWKDKAFWVCCAVMFFFGTFMPLIHYSETAGSDEPVALEAGFFMFAAVVVIITAAFVALFVGTEYSDGTIRNKIIAGQKRGSIYFANLITCIAAGVLMCVAYLVPHICIGIPLLGSFTCGVVPIIVYTLCILVTMTAFVAIYVAIAMLCQSKAHSAIACILLALVLLMGGVITSSCLSEPEYYDAYSVTENGVTVTQGKEPNPNYLSGTKREVFERIFDINPGGQVVQLSGMEGEPLWNLALYALAITLASTAVGMAAFKKKDLK